MKRIVFFALLFLLFATNVESMEYPYPYYPLPEYSAAATFGSLAILTNPAALAAFPDLELFYLHSFDRDRFAGDNSILLAKQGLGFGYQNYRLDADPSISAYTLAFSSRVMRGFYLGSSYTFMKTEHGNPYHNDHFWNFGMLFQNNRSGSLAFTARNLRRMEFGGHATEIEYTLSAGHRPLGEHVTLSADWSWNESQAFTDGFFKGYLSLAVKQGLAVYGSVDEDGNFGFGLNLSLGNNQIGSYHNYRDDGHYRSGIIYSGYSFRPRGWILPLQKRYLKLTLGGSYPETGRRIFPWQTKPETFLDLVSTLNRALEDEQVVGLFIELKELSLGWAQIQELRDIMHAFRERGKPVLAYLGNLTGNGGYYLASAASQTAMKRVDALSLTGLLAEVTFYKGSLDKLGVVADLEQEGRYKSTAELFTDDSMSTWHRQALDLLLDDFAAEFSRQIAQDRRLPHDSLLAIIDRGPHTSEEAQLYGLIDTVLYPDEIEVWLKAHFARARPVDYARYRQYPPFFPQWGEPDQIAVIPVEGMLVRGKSRNDLLFGETIGADDLLAAIKKARQERHIKAVVLRLNTPGGEGLPADLIHRELLLLRKEKPLIVSMGNVAASAGYNLAAAGDYILTQPSTVTGSIGVIYGKLDLSGLREKIGFNTYILKRGKNADFFSSSIGFSREQRDKLRSQLRLMYENFVQVVADGRKLTREYVDSIGQGRIWSGQRGVQLHLADQIGGLWAAIQKAREMAGLENEEVALTSFPAHRPRLFGFSDGLAGSLSFLKSLLMGYSLNNASRSTDIESPFYYLPPFLLKIY